VGGRWVEFSLLILSAKISRGRVLQGKTRSGCLPTSLDRAGGLDFYMHTYVAVIGLEADVWYSVGSLKDLALSQRMWLIMTLPSSQYFEKRLEYSLQPCHGPRLSVSKNVGLAYW